MFKIASLLMYSVTYNKGLSKKQTTSIPWTNPMSQFDFTIDRYRTRQCAPDAPDKDALKILTIILEVLFTRLMNCPLIAPCTAQMLFA